MKIRFYHMWVYKLFYYVWDPILRSRPDLVVLMQQHTDHWIRKHIKVDQ